MIFRGRLDIAPILFDKSLEISKFQVSNLEMNDLRRWLGNDDPVRKIGVLGHDGVGIFSSVVPNVGVAPFVIDLDNKLETLTLPYRHIAWKICIDHKPLHARTVSIA